MRKVLEWWRKYLVQVALDGNLKSKAMNKKYSTVRADIPINHLFCIIDEVRENKHTENAIKKLKNNGVISSQYSDSCYKRRLYKMAKYRQLMEDIKKEKKDYKQKIIDLKKQGKTYKEIIEATGVNYNTIYSIINKTYVKEKREEGELTQTKARSIVRWVKANPMEGRFYTQETKDAFELLGLKLPA